MLFIYLKREVSKNECLGTLTVFSIMKFFLACTDTVLCVIVSHHILPYVRDNVHTDGCYHRIKGFILRYGNLNYSLKEDAV